MSATPRPWEIVYSGDESIIVDADGHPVANCFGDEAVPLIVNAVNAHAALVEVMRAAEELIRDSGTDWQGQAFEPAYSSRVNLIAAIAKSKEVVK